ncbi:LysM peptidoglycan-binding domain-containing protein [Staphylococcus auricularis]|uniref:LysM peptidoglycan-binding domain-containing protein n=1 Tax=Staphylococcus auricularis TaxID=29379 RepID=UPI001932D8A9|nr:LysM peptidoglycan-binding domain-containing protein [Staphylococcus auricularis]MBM0868264.1 LysM peptidoglycan-binding domain-containing protein [Staphylococcus auricularis]
MKAFFNKANRFSIKKLTIGTASVVIGSVLFLGFSGEVQASEQSDEVTSEHSDQGTDDLNEDTDSTDAVDETSRENGETQPNEAENEAIPQSEANTDTPQAEDTEAHEEVEEVPSEGEDADNVTTGQEDTQDDSETDAPQDNQNEADESDEAAASASNESKQDDTEEAPAAEKKDASSNEDDPQLNETTATDVHEQQIDPLRQKEIEELEHEESEVTVDDEDADNEEAQLQKEIEELEHEESEVTVDDDDEDDEEAQRQKEIEELEHEESEVTVDDDDDDDEETQRQKEIEELKHEESEVTVDDDDADNEEDDADDEEAQRQKEIEELEHEESEVTVDDDDAETGENNDFETDTKDAILSANHTNLKAHQDELNTYLAENHISEKTIQYINENWDNMNDKAIYQAILKDFNDKTNKYKTFATTPTTSRSRATDAISREAAPEKTMDYTVEEGDFLGGIADKFETSTEHLQELNDIPNPDVIHTGQVLKVPDHSNAEPPEPPAPEAPQVKDYTVESGDTLSGIAGKFDTSTEHLQELNHLPNPDQLDVGQVLKVPDTGAAEPATQPPQPEPGNDAQLVTMDQLQRFGWNAEDLNEHFLNDLNHALHRYQINTPPRIQHFMAQVGEESSLGQFRTELVDGTGYEGVEEIGNTQPGDGPKYKGGGYIQLTGRSNYTAFSQSMGDPEILNQGTNYVAENYPWSSAAWFWDSRNINSTVDNGGSVADVTQIVNGGQNGYDERLRLYEKAKTIFV